MRAHTGSHLAAVAGLIAATTLMPGAAGATGFEWRLDGSPWAKGTATLTAATVADAELWVVGSVSDPTTGHSRGLVGRGPGEFRLFPAGDADPDLNVELSAVDSAGDDVWVVGRSWPGTGGPQTRIVRYDRRDPDSGGQVYPGTEGRLWGIDMLTPSDGWAVGASDGTLVLHWDGTTWTRTPSPGGNELTAVTARATDDVWAVGHAADQARTLVLHWDGTEWTTIPSPDPVAGANKLLGVTVAGNDIWAVGYGNTDSSDADESQRHAFAMRWDGQAWLVLPSLSARATQFTGVTASSDTDVWIAGYAVADDEYVHIEHWDGSTLRNSQIEFPYNSGHIASALSGIVGGPSAGPLWAVGWQLTDRVPVRQPAVFRQDR